MRKRRRDKIVNTIKNTFIYLIPRISLSAEKDGKLSLDLTIDKKDLSLAMEDVIEGIIKISECHSFYFQYFCHEIWEIARDKKKVTKESIDSTFKYKS